MSHFTHTREGAAESLGLGNLSQVDRFIKLACNTGHTVSKIIGGIEYFDVDILERYGTAKKQVEEVIDYSIEYIEVEVTRKRRRKKKIVAQTVEQFYDYSNRKQAVFLFD